MTSPLAPGEQGAVDLEVDVVLDELDVAVGERDVDTAGVAADGASRVREVRVGRERRRAAAEFTRDDHALGRVVGPHELVRTRVLRDPAMLGVARQFQEEERVARPVGHVSHVEAEVDRRHAVARVRPAVGQPLGAAADEAGAGVDAVVLPRAPGARADGDALDDVRDRGARVGAQSHDGHGGVRQVALRDRDCRSRRPRAPRFRGCWPRRPEA